MSANETAGEIIENDSFLSASFESLDEIERRENAYQYILENHDDDISDEFRAEIQNGYEQMNSQLEFIRRAVTEYLEEKDLEDLDIDTDGLTANVDDTPNPSGYPSKGYKPSDERSTNGNGKLPYDQWREENKSGDENDANMLYERGYDRDEDILTRHKDDDDDDSSRGFQ